MTKTITGTEIATKIYKDLALSIDKLADDGITPCLALIVVGSDPVINASASIKEKTANQIGIETRVVRLSEYITQKELLDEIRLLNADNGIDGISIQLPLPEKLDISAAYGTIAPEKDADGCHPQNIGKLFTGDACTQACIAKSAVLLLKQLQVRLDGANVVIAGRSNMVGKPLAALLLNENATVTVCHNRTRDLKAKCLEADILITAAGIGNLIKQDMVKPGAVVVDAALGFDAENRPQGDVADPQVEKIAAVFIDNALDIAPLSIAILLENTVEAAKRNGQLG